MTFTAAETTTASASLRGVSDAGSGSEDKSHTTSTVSDTRTSAIIARPSRATDCRTSAKTTYVTIETVVVSTTICLVTAAEATATSGANAGKSVEAIKTKTASPIGSEVFDSRPIYHPDSNSLAGTPPAQQAPSPPPW